MSVPAPQAELFLRELATCRNVSAAARAAGLRQRQAIYLKRDRDPQFRARWDEALGREPPPAPPAPRIPIELMTPEQRRLARQLLDSLNQDPPGSVQQRARDALAAWLAGRAWPSISAAVADELRRISPRAFDDYQRATVPTPTVNATGEQ